MSATTPTSGAADLPEALRPIQRYEVVDCIDSKHVPAVIPNPHGPWVRYEDHAAALTAQAISAPTDHSGDVNKMVAPDHIAESGNMVAQAISAEPAGATVRHLEAVIKGAADKLDAAVRCHPNAVDTLIHEALEILDGDREPYCTPTPQTADTGADTFTPYGSVTTHSVTGQQFFYAKGESPYLDNASECVTVYAKEKHPRQSDQGTTQVAGHDTGRTSSTGGAGADQHHQHRVGEPVTQRAASERDSRSTGLHGSRDVSQEVTAQAPAQGAGITAVGGVAQEVYGPFDCDFVGAGVWAGIVDELPPSLVGKKVYITTTPQPAPPADSVLEDAALLTSEQEYAIRQGHEIAASDSHFDARPQIESKDRRKVFQAGFERGWDAARKQRGAT